MKKVYVRFYDQDNLGDDLFLQILTNRYMGSFSIRKTNSAGSFVSSDGVSVVRESRFVSWLDRVLSRLMGSRFIISYSAIRRNDLMVFVGGSIFMERTVSTYWERERRFFEQIKIPYYVIGSNFGPHKSKRFVDIVRSIVAGAEDVCFRDQASYETFKDIKTARVATDIAFTLDTSKYDKMSEKLAIFSIINGDKRFSPEITKKYEQEIVNLARKLATQGYKVVLMSFCKHEGDENAISRMIENGGEGFEDIVSVHNYSGNLEESLALLAKSEIIVASRFHAAILGLLFGKKVLPMAYSAKTTNILKDMKFRGPVIDINEIADFDGSSFDFGTLEVNDVSDQVKLAEKQFQELDKVLTKR